MKQANPFPVFIPQSLNPYTLSTLERLLDGETIVKCHKRRQTKKGLPTGCFKTTITQSIRPPNVEAVRFVLERLFPDRYCNQQTKRQEIQTIAQLVSVRPCCLFVFFDFRVHRNASTHFKAHLSPQLIERLNWPLQSRS